MLTIRLAGASKFAQYHTIFVESAFIIIKINIFVRQKHKKALTLMELVMTFIFIQNVTFVYADSFTEAKLFDDSNWFSLPFLICLLLCIIILSLICYHLLNRLKKNRRIAMIDAACKEAQQKLKEIEEQAVILDMEKYRALSDVRLKELELISITKELEQLHNNKDELEEQLELIQKKYEAYEVLTEEEKHKNVDLQFVILEDLRRLFSKHTSGENKWIRNLGIINKSFIDSINERGGGNLSVSNLKYCICFTIGMTTSEIAECFNIEQASVHMIKYRLKKKFSLRNEDDLEFFFQHQLHEKG